MKQKGIINIIFIIVGIIIILVLVGYFMRSQNNQDYYENLAQTQI